MRNSETIVFIKDPILSHRDMFILTYSRFIMEKDNISCLPLLWYQKYFTEDVLEEFFKRKYLIKRDDGYAVDELLRSNQPFLPIPREISISIYEDLFSRMSVYDLYTLIQNSNIFSIYIFFAHKTKTWAYKHYFQTFYFSIKILCTFLGIPYDKGSIKKIKDNLQWLVEKGYIDIEEIPKQKRHYMMPYKLNRIALREKEEFLTIEEVAKVYNY